MADTTEDEITIDELSLTEAVQSGDDFVVQQSGTTKRVKLSTLDELFHYIKNIEQTVTSAAPSGKNEVTVTLSNGDTYVFEITNGDGFTGVTITEATGSAEYNTLVFHMSNSVDYTLKVRNGHGISSMSQTKTSTEDEGENTFTFTSTSGETADFTVKNGSKGSKGDTGNRSTITVGTVKTGEPGTSVAIENVGDEHDAVFNFTIPKGDTGDAGDLDTELNDTSTNGVQNKVIKAAVDYCLNATETVSEDTTVTGLKNDTKYIITGGSLTMEEAETGVIITVFAAAATTLTINGDSESLSENEVKQYIYKNEWYEITGSDMSEEKPTFTVDSDTKLSQWFKNDTSAGQDYSYVYIAEGTWKYTLTDTGKTSYTICNIEATQKVKGDKKSLIEISGVLAGSSNKTVNIFKGTYGAGHDATNDDYDLGYMQDVTVSVSLYCNNSTTYQNLTVNVFTNLTNLTHCIVTDTWIQAVEPKFQGFSYCKNLENCYVYNIEVNFYDYDDFSDSNYIVVFVSCNVLVNCRTKNLHVYSDKYIEDCDDGEPDGYTFYNCNWVTKCLTYSENKIGYVTSGSPAVGTKFSSATTTLYSGAISFEKDAVYSGAPSAKVAIAYTEAGGYNIVSDIAESAILIPDSIW